MLRTEAARWPPVSVLIPVYDDEPYVGAAVWSILQQTSRSRRRAVAEALRRRGSKGAAEMAMRSPPPIEVDSDGQLHRKWSWWALNAGSLRTARPHALLAVATEPLSLANPRLLACVVRDSLGARR